MDQSQAGAAQPLSRVALGLFATVAGSITLAWFAFLVWLDFKALRCSDRRLARFSLSEITAW
jgi:hypothetical protein